MKQHLLGSALAIAAPIFLLTSGCSVESDPGERTGEAQSAASICPGDTVVHGVDVSYYQGDIDWNAAAADGIKFAIARKSDGTFLDTKFDQNWEGMKAAGIIRGVYQFFEPDGDVAEQAQIVIDAVGPLGAGDLPAMIDVEKAGNLSNAAYADKIGQWMDLVEAGTGKRPMIYTGKYFWQDNVASGAFNDVPLIDAAYPNACYSTSSAFTASADCWMGSCPNIADQFDDWQFWQFTSQGKVDGIPGHVDRDIFNGDMAALQLLAGGGWAGAVVSIDVPATMVAGETVTAHVTVKNVGSETWDASTKLGTTGPRDRESAFADPSWEGPNRAAHVAMPVGPGETYEFEFPLHAPSKVGGYVETFGLVEEGVTWFADQGGPPDDAVKLELQVVAGPPNDGAGGGGGEGGGGPTDSGDDKCSCSTVGADTTSSSWSMIGLVGAGAAFARRRRRG